MANAEMFEVTVVYALPERQVVKALTVEAGTTVYQAAAQSGLAAEFGLDLEQLELGVFGKAEKAPKERVLKAGERVEIYRPLLIDPKEARKARAEKVRKAKLQQG